MYSRMSSEILMSHVVFVLFNVDYNMLNLLITNMNRIKKKLIILQSWDIKDPLLYKKYVPLFIHLLFTSAGILVP